MVIFDLDLPEWRPLLDPVSTLVYSASAASVRTVLVDGRVLLDDRRVTTVDEREVLARVERLAGPLPGARGTRRASEVAGDPVDRSSAAFSARGGRGRRAPPAATP